MGCHDSAIVIIIQKTIIEMEKSVVSGEILPANAAWKLLEMWHSSKK